MYVGESQRKTARNTRKNKIEILPQLGSFRPAWDMIPVAPAFCSFLLIATTIMARNNSSMFLLVFFVIFAFCLSHKGVYAFGAGNIPSCVMITYLSGFVVSS